ncbi:MAG TPA: hypothetical protein VND22_09030, partial [Actinomycetota bacterium]|nr:hypothetical protein [Actinomycetota bacterium]
AAGKELAGAVRLLAQWGSGRTSETEAIRHDTCGTALEARWYCPTCAETVDASEEGLGYV